mmetsp:Transcript_32148/g.81166  ORF Transcript_32148/g.81166 Transcript_32148/m.81166 type:complete len:408 (+) Transcript_32148:74-1297(+)
MPLRWVLIAAMAKVAMVVGEVAVVPECALGHTHSAAVDLQELRFVHHGQQRRYLLFAPAQQTGEPPLPLVLLAPGTAMPPRRAFDISGFRERSRLNRFAVVVLVGERDLLNVELHGQAHADGADDVSYTQAAIHHAGQQLCTDLGQVFCAGYSRGARFCSRLASELSGVVRAIAPVGGARFPAPNNATRPMPIVAFHGTQDPINPYTGNGDPTYWHTSVPSAIALWAEFNKCRHKEQHTLASGVVMHKHTKCADDADVLLITIDGGGHTWPGSKVAYFDRSVFGMTSNKISASDMIWKFFLDHAGASPARAGLVASTELVGASTGPAAEAARGAVAPAMLGSIVAGCGMVLLFATLAAAALRARPVPWSLRIPRLLQSDPVDVGSDTPQALDTTELLSDVTSFDQAP